jgi:two-component system invasion response regulator UvrY
MNYKILLADDHSMILKALRMVLELQFGHSCTRSVTSCKEVLDELRNEGYTHLVLDINLADGNSIDMLPAIRGFFPSLKVMVFSMHPANIYAEVLRRRYGIHHYISKSAKEGEIMATIQHFFQYDQKHLHSTTSVVSGSPSNPFLRLSRREQDVLHHILLRKATGEIANALKLRNNTISTLKKRILEKTQTSDTVTLTELADLYGIV